MFSVSGKAIRTTAAGLLGAVVLTAPGPALAGPCNARKSSCTSTADTTAPLVAISSPAGGTTVSGAITVTGTASDNVALSKVELQVDGGLLQTVTGLSTWSRALDTKLYANGAHTLTARATDTSGNVRTTAVSFVVSNAVADTTAPAVSISSPASGATVPAGTVTVGGSASDAGGVAKVEVSVDGGIWQLATGTTSWSRAVDSSAWAAGSSHTISARALDSIGNAATTSASVTVAQTTTSTGTTGSQHWVSPEGATIEIAAGLTWTVDQIYQILQENSAGPGDFAAIAPKLKIKVQTTGASSTTASASTSSGVFTQFSATIYLNASENTTFSIYPDASIGHEYGHVWTMYHLYLSRQGDWSSFLGTRWANADGSIRLAGDSRLDTSYMWDKGEIAADDYRLLFGSAAAISQRNAHLNWQIPDARSVAELRTFFLSTWTG